MKADSIRIINYLLTSVALAAYFVLTGWDNLFAVIFLFLYTMSPLAINAIVALFAKTRASQVVLLCTTIAYAAWACFLFVDVYSSTDGQAGFTLLLTAIAASPVLLIAWVACLVIEIIERKKGHGRQRRPNTEVSSPLPRPT